MQNRSVVSYYSSDKSQIDKWNHFWNEKGLIAVENLLSKTSGSFRFPLLLVKKVEIRLLNAALLFSTTVY